MDSSNFSRHKKWHAGEYSCDICHVSYAENKSLQKHIRKLHRLVLTSLLIMQRSQGIGLDITHYQQIYLI